MTTNHGYTGAVVKPRRWAEEPANDVPTVTLPDSSVAEAVVGLLYAWDATSGTFIKLTVDHATGNLNVSSSGGGGGAATIADGADVAQGAIADVAYTSGSGTVVSLLKGIFGRLASVAVTGTFWQATQPVSVAAPTTIYNGKKTVTTAGTRVTLASSQAVRSVVIKALVANTGTIYVGDGSVSSTTGFALSPGDTVSLDIANLATVNLDSSVNGEGVTYLGTN